MGKFPDNVYFKNYKCFKEYVGFSKITTSNVIIGKNNIGKSSLVDLLRILIESDINDPVRIKCDVSLDESILRNYFREDTRGGDIPGVNHWYEMGRLLVGFKIPIELSNGWNPSYTESIESLVQRAILTREGRELLKNLKNPFVGYEIGRISAERDIVKESGTNGDLKLEPDGKGATNYVEAILNRVGLDSNLIQVEMLNAFNKIMQPEIKLNNIVTQKDNSIWEIYLDDSINGRIALSQSGSGLKTVILVLLHLLVVPKYKNIDPAKIIYIFEELENNLHPALQRSLFTYIHNFAMENGSTIFFTTHSNVVIDLFSKFENSQTILIKNQNGIIKTEEVKDIFHKRSIFEELDVRASDLLQSNSIIWVEGPSDRVYINKWLSLIDNKGLTEGLHYQYMYYGGRLLSHYSANDLDDKLSLLKANRNSIIFIDSDKKSPKSHINDTKRRIRDEFSKSGLICHITEGREIENYLSHRVLSSYLGKSTVPPLERYEDIKDYLNKIEKDSGNKFESSKVKFAESISPAITIEDMKESYGLLKFMEEVLNQIYAWNKL